ncbi:MAG: GGDEF domain-containing protein [Gammaproteobacteria bacterium]|nr:GGDEF domain-containing protein [Gammaproteobacteria bacterium]
MAADLKLKEWSGPSASVRMALLLGLATLLFVGNGFVDSTDLASRLPAVGGAVLVYIIAVSVLTWLPAARAEPRRQAIAYTVVMVAIVPVVAALSGVSGMASLLLIPALHASLRLGQRSAVAAGLVCAVLWVVLRNLHEAFSIYRVVVSMIELLPIALVFWVVRGLSGDVADTRNQITALSYRDELTGLLNMRAFTRMLQSEHHKASAGAGQYALLMVDIDRLQLFNDRYGHEQGNRVIVAVADAIKRSVRSNDMVARYGGDEFVIFLPGAGDELAEVVSNRIGQNVYNITLSFDKAMQRVAVNTGRAIYPDSGDGLQDIMSFADRAMYRDKEFKRSVAERKSDQAMLKAQAGVEDWS